MKSTITINIPKIEPFKAKSSGLIPHITPATLKIAGVIAIMGARKWSQY